MKKTILFILILVFVSSLSFGHFLTGNDLYSYISKWKNAKSPKNFSFTIEYNQAIGYILGIHDCFDNYLFDTPAKVTRGQIGDIVFKYLKEHPEERHKPGSRLVVDALKEAFPKEEEKEEEENV